MKIKELRDKSAGELAQVISEQQDKLAELAIDYRTKQVSNVKQIAAAKRIIARALTLQRERELMAEGDNNG